MKKVLGIGCGGMMLLVGCLIVGVLVQISAQIIPVDLKYLGGLAVLIVILVIRPQGLLGSRARIG